MGDSEFVTALTSGDKARKRTFEELMEVSMSSGSEAEVTRTRVPMSTMDSPTATRRWT